jgi:TonB family protein
MSRRLERIATFLRGNALAVGAGAVLLGGAVAGVRWISSNRDAPAPRKVMQYTMVKVQTPEQPKPPPPPVQTPKVEEQVQTERVEIKTTDIPPPESSGPAPGPAAGPLALATEGDGPGDQFNLAGNPGGRSLTGGGGFGEGTGDGLGGASSPGARFGWYYGKMAKEIEEVFRRQKAVTSAAVRVELRIWADPSGRITRVELIRSTGDSRLDEAIQSVVGLRLAEPPPRDLPMPMIARLTARRPG